MKYSWSRKPFFTIVVIRDLNSPLGALSDWSTNFGLILEQVYRSALSVACLLVVLHGQMMYNQGHSIRHPLCFQLAGRKHHGPHGLYHSWFSDSLPLFWILESILSGRNIFVLLRNIRLWILIFVVIVSVV